MEKNTMKIGLFGIGLDTYCPQFEGLKERLEGYLRQIKKTRSHQSVHCKRRPCRYNRQCI